MAFSAHTEPRRAPPPLAPSGGGSDRLIADGDQWRAMGQRVWEVACGFDESRPPSGASDGLVDRLREPPPEHGGPLEPLLQLLLQAAAQAEDTSGPRAFGHVPGSALPSAVLGEILAAMLNRHTAFATSAPGFAALEHGVLRWLADQIGLPPGAGGVFSSGGSISTLTALAAARAALSDSALPQATVYLADSAHACVHKALRVLGVEQRQVRRVGTDVAGRMDPDALAALVDRDRRRGRAPWLVIATAGTTDRGVVDPLTVLAHVAHTHRAWLHVDGAYGGAFALTTRGRAVLRGIEHADSVVIDGHKALFLPFGTGMLLVRDQRVLQRAFRVRAAYLRDLPDHPDLANRADLGLELTAGNRAVRLWLPLWLHGAGAFRAALDEKWELARHAYHRLAREPALEVFPPQLTTFTVRVRGGGDTATRQLVDAVNASGRARVSSTVVDGRLQMRVCVMSLRTRAQHVDELVDTVLAAVRAAPAAG